MFHMFSVIFAHEKVVRRIVLLVKVLVVDFFGADKRSANGFLCNQNMFKNISLAVCSIVQWAEYFFVALFDNKRLLSVIGAALSRAVFWVFVVGYKYSSAVQAVMRRGCCLVSRYFWRRVSQFNVVTTAISFAEMFIRTSVNFAELGRAFWLLLLIKAASFLPRSIACGITKRHLCIRVNDSGYYRPAVSACFRHSIISELSTETIIAPYSLEYEGRK